MSTKKVVTEPEDDLELVFYYGYARWIRNCFFAVKVCPTQFRAMPRFYSDKNNGDQKFRFRFFRSIDNFSTNFWTLFSNLSFEVFDNGDEKIPAV